MMEYCVICKQPVFDDITRYVVPALKNKNDYSAFTVKSGCICPTCRRKYAKLNYVLTETHQGADQTQ